jgi:hypothetical protein
MDRHHEHGEQDRSLFRNWRRAAARTRSSYRQGRKRHPAVARSGWRAVGRNTTRHLNRIARERRRQDLDGDVATEAQVSCPVHLAHAAGAKGGHQVIVAQSGTSRQRHDGW